jgi:flavin reductase (DIM6/NTAB) family NADH-FMN oxidoreductase RutF
VSIDPLFHEGPSPASPYPGWMQDQEGQAYEYEVTQHFLTAMSSLAATVCVVAASTPAGERYGITATAVCSLSTEPPQLVACVNRNSSMAKALEETGWFSVNILAGSQEAVAGTFAGRTGKKGSERFDEHDWTQHLTGAPVLADAAAVCVCHVSNCLRQTSHLVVIGRVLDVILPERDEPSPLMYHQRRFTTVTSELFNTPVNSTRERR